MGAGLACSSEPAPTGWSATPPATASTGCATSQTCALHSSPTPRPSSTALERYGLVDDAWASVLAGTTGAAAFIELAEGMTDETDLAVWTRMLGALDSLDRAVAPGRRSALAARTCDIVRPALDAFGWDPADQEDDRDRERRGLLLGALATLGDDPEAIGRARGLFDAYRADPDRVDANLAATAINVVATLATPDDFEAIVAGFEGASTPQEEQRYLYSLAGVRDQRAVHPRAST